VSLIDFLVALFPVSSVYLCEMCFPVGATFATPVQIKMRLFGMRWSWSHDLDIDDGPRCSVDVSTRHRGRGCILHWA
jgi:hypothetical protein